MIGLSLLGLAQIIGGAAIAVFSLGAGASIGLGLLSEGVGDLITAVKDGIINRDFSWVAYGIQKAISLTVSIVCAGLGAIKDAAKAAAAGVKQIVAGTTKVLTETVKNGWKLAAKQIGTALAKGVAKELVTELVNYGVEKALMPSIEAEVIKRVELPIQNALLSNNKVKKMLELDGINRNSYFQSLIKEKALEILNPKNDPSHPFATIIQGIIKGIASQKIKGLSTVIQIKEALEAIDKLNNYVPEFIESLNKEIKNIYKNEKVNEKLEASLNKNKQTNQKQSGKIKSQSYQSSAPIPNEDIEDLIGGDSSKEHEQVKLNKSAKSPDELSEKLAKSVSTKMCNLIQGKLITPVTSAGINMGMNKVFSSLDKSLEKEMENYKAERRIEFFQNKDPDNRIPDEYKKKNEQSVKKADKIIADLENGGEAGLPHLGSLSDEIGRPINVYDEDGKLVRIIGPDKNGEPVEIEYHKPNESNPKGHWTSPGGIDSNKFSNIDNNNCLFNVIADQCNLKDPDKLRMNTANRMRENKDSLAFQANDIIRLETYKNNALAYGGCKKETLNPNDIQFSQETVSGFKWNKKTKEYDHNYMENMAEDMHAHGFKEEGRVDVVEMRDGSRTTVDNRRVSAAREAGVDVLANVHKFDEPLPEEHQKRNQGNKAENWEQFILDRIADSRNSEEWRSKNKYGCKTNPHILQKGNKKSG